MLRMSSRFRSPEPPVTQPPSPQPVAHQPAAAPAAPAAPAAAVPPPPYAPPASPAPHTPARLSAASPAPVGRMHSGQVQWRFMVIFVGNLWNFLGTSMDIYGIFMDFLGFL